MTQTVPGADRVEPLPLPWRTFTVRGWIGAFHADSELCEEEIKNKHGKKP